MSEPTPLADEQGWWPNVRYDGGIVPAGEHPVVADPIEQAPGEAGGAAMVILQMCEFCFSAVPRTHMAQHIAYWKHAK